MGSTPMKHKYAVGDRVRNINPDLACCGQEGVIRAILPYTFIAPAYYVKYDNDSSSRTVAVSERSLEKVEVQNVKS